jgi:carbonic anhydrase
MTAQEIIHKLKSGNESFVNNKNKNENQDNIRRESLVGGQSPYAIILGCADSRVVPELAFDTGLGELFVVRVAGNIANTSSIASIEYAVSQLGVKVIVVLGHESCGAVTAAINGGDLGNNLNHLVSFIKPAVESSNKDSSIDEVVKINAIENANKLASNSEVISGAISSGDLIVQPAFYNLKTGKVDFL